MKILNKITKSIKSNQGSALVIVLFIVMLVSIFGFSLLKISANSLKQVDHERTDQAVFYIAEAGMNLAKLEVKNQLNEIEKSSSREIDLWIAKENAERKALKKEPLTKAEAEAEYRNILNGEFAVFNDTKTFTISGGKTADVELDFDLPNTSKLLYQINLSSTGSIEHAKDRVVKQNIKVEPKLIFGDGGSETGGGNNGNGDGQTPSGTPEGYAVLTNGDILFNDSGKIYGNVASSQGNITFKNWSAKINGVVSIDETTQQINRYGNAPIPDTVAPLNINVTDFLQDTFFPKEKFKPTHFNSIKTFNDTEISNPNKHFIYKDGNFNAKDDGDAAKNFTIDLTGHSSLRFNNFSVGGDKTIYIDVGEKDTDLYIENLDISGDIIIKGSGKLNLFVNNFTKLKGSFNDNGESTQVNFIYNGTKPFILSGDTPFYGSLLNKSANISIGGSAAIYGNIISKGNSIAISGASPVKGQSIIAPYANLEMSGSAKIYGTTVVDTITINGGGSEIHYATPVYPLPPGVGPENDFTDLPPPKNNGFWIDESNMIEK